MLWLFINKHKILYEATTNLVSINSVVSLEWESCILVHQKQHMSFHHLFQYNLLIQDNLLFQDNLLIQDNFLNQYNLYI